MDRTRWIIFIALCAIVLGGLVLFSGKDRVDVSRLDPTAIMTKETLASNGVTQADAIADHIYGNPDAKVVVIEYADFQCPGCHSAFTPLQSVKTSHKNSTAFVFRNFPLTSAHPNALAAATTAEAAGLQGKFWEMHDLLFGNWDEWRSTSGAERTAVFEQYATQLGLNIDQFRSDLTSKSISQKISRDRALAAKVKVSATPTIYINGTKISDSTSDDLLSGKTAGMIYDLNAAIKATGGTPPAIQQ